MKLHLLIDTSVWLDLTKDPRHLPLLDALFAMIESNEVILILPQIVVDEFERNKVRVMEASRARLSSHFKQVREAIAQFGALESREAILKHLNEVDHRIATGGEAVNEAVSLVEEVFRTTVPVPIDDEIKVRAADRAIAKRAPFHRQVNGIGDAIIFEVFIDALNDRIDPEDVYAFVTHNTHDFSLKGADTRLPHPDLASHFDGVRSRYSTNLGALLNEFANDLIEEITFDREFNQEPRRLTEILEAERKLFRQIWYNRHCNFRAAIESGAQKIVSREEWESAGREAWQGMVVNGVWEIALAAAKRTEEELGPEQLGPWDDFEWGMLNGKLSALRWVMGEEWDMLDT